MQESKSRFAQKEQGGFFLRQKSEQKVGGKERTGQKNRDPQSVRAYFTALGEVAEGDGVLQKVKDLLDLRRMRVLLFFAVYDGRRFHEVRIPLILDSTDGELSVLIGPKSWEPLYLTVQAGSGFFNYERLSDGTSWRWRRHSSFVV